MIKSRDGGHTVLGERDALYRSWIEWSDRYLMRHETRIPTPCALHSGHCWNSGSIT